MLSLGSLLTRYSQKVTSAPLGSDGLQPPSLPPAPTLDKEQFRRDLQGLRRTSLWSVLAVVIVAVGVGTVFALLIERNFGDPDLVTSLFVGFATICGTLTAVIVTLFRMIAQGRILDILSRNLDVATVQSVIDALASQS